MATERFRFYAYDELMAWDKASHHDLTLPDMLLQEICNPREAALAALPVR